MKTLRASSWLVAIAFVAAAPHASHAGTQDLPADTAVAQSKLRRDGASMSLFRYLGKTHCLDVMTARKPGDFSTEYGILYNKLYPLPRLISEESLRATFTLMEKGLNSVGGYGARSRSRFADPISVCTQLYEEGSKSTSAYRALVSDPRSLHTSEDVDLQKHIQDYLQGYFIKAPR